MVGVTKKLSFASLADRAQGSYFGAYLTEYKQRNISCKFKAFKTFTTLSLDLAPLIPVPLTFGDEIQPF